MDFQIFSKISDFILYTATIWHFGPVPSSAAIKGRGLGDCEFVSRALLLVRNLNNDRPPACKIEKSVTINCEFSLPRLNIDPVMCTVQGRPTNRYQFNLSIDTALILCYFIPRKRVVFLLLCYFIL